MENKDFIRKKLLATKREGMEGMLQYMEDEGFFDAPCSGGNHLACAGGLAQHTRNVMEYAAKIGTAVYGKKDFGKIADSVTIAAALHDLGKMGQYGKSYYVPNMLKSGKQSTSKPYEVNKDLLHVDHCIRSVILATLYLDLTEDEQNAILYHDGLYGALKYEVNSHETPLMLIIHWADMWVSRYVETQTLEDAGGDADMSGLYHGTKGEKAAAQQTLKEGA